MIMKHPRIRSQKIITDTLRDKMDNSFFFLFKDMLIVGFQPVSGISLGIFHQTQKAGMVRKYPRLKKKPDQPEKFRVW